jgi:prevent-host-death family protein
MREVQASVAKTQLLALLDEVERGETLVITRHGKPIARLVPEQSHRQQEIDAAVARIEARRRTMPHVTTEEILEWIREGRRY